VLSFKLHFAESRCKELGCIWRRSRALPVSVTNTTIVDSLLVTFLCSTWDFTPFNYSSVTILLPSSLTTSPFSSSHSSSQLTLLPHHCFWPSIAPCFWLTFPVSEMFPSLCQCIILPLSIQGHYFYLPASFLLLSYYSSPSHSHCSFQNFPTLVLCSAMHYISRCPYITNEYQFSELLVTLSLMCPGTVVLNTTCSDSSTTGIVISGLPFSRFLSQFRLCVSQGWPNLTCLDPDFSKMIVMDITIPWRLMCTDSATWVKSNWLPSAVIIFLLAHFHPMCDSLVTSSLIT